MALTGTDRGSGNHNTSALTFTLSPSGNFAAGSMAVLVIAADNAHTSGTAFTTFTVTDTLGNTWTRRTSPLFDPGAASAGIEGAIFTTLQNGGTLQTGTVITVTFDTATTAKAWALHEVVPTNSGYSIQYKTGANNTGATTGTPTVTTGSITSGDMVIGGGMAESGDTWAGDADTTNGNWSTHQHAAAGTGATGMSVTSQRKVVTATATQTYNPTLTSADVILSWIQLHEIGIRGYGQAQAQIKAFGVEAFGQAQATIKGISRGFGQAQALIPSRNVSGQAQAQIRQAVRFVQEVGTASNGAAVTHNIAISTAPTKNNHLLLFLNAAGNKTFTVTDTKSNTWTQRSIENAGTTATISVWECKNTNGLTTSDTVDVTLNTSQGIGAKIYEYESAVDGWFDVVAEGNDPNSGITAFTTATTSTPAQNRNLVVAFLTLSATATVTVDNPTGLVNRVSGFGPTDFARVGFIYDKVITDGSAQIFSGTYSTARQNVCTVLVFKEADLTQVSDTFTRTETDAWGRADIGGQWTLTQGLADDFDVDGSIATAQMSAGTSKNIALPSTTVFGNPGGVSFRFRFKLDVLPDADTIFLYLVENFGSLTTDPNVSSNNIGLRLSYTSSNTTVTVQRYTPAGTGSGKSAVITANTWYVVEATFALTSNSQIRNRTNIYQEGTTPGAYNVNTQTNSGYFPGHPILRISQKASGNTPLVSIDDIQIMNAGWTESGQAQAFIRKSAGYGQAQAVISRTYTNVLDTFTRSVSNDLGTADVGGAWTQTSGNAVDGNVNGTEATIQVGTSYISHLQNVLVVNPEGLSIKYRFKWSALTDVNFNGFQIFGSMGSSATNTGYSQDVGYTLAGSTFNLSDLIGSTSVAAIANEWFVVETTYVYIASTGTTRIRRKIWRESTGSTDYVESTSTSPARVLPGHAGLRVVGKSSGTQPLISIDDIEIKNAGWTESGQAQATIVAGVSATRVHAQAQADIKQTYTDKTGQAQADIKQTYFGLGQAQADIKAVGYGLGQAQADIKATSWGLGQAQADIKATSFGLGQAQADIKQTYTDKTGQAQADIKATRFILGQAQADIKAIGYGFGQAQADIKAVGRAYGQAQADIKAIGRAYGQAQADIKQTYPLCGGNYASTILGDSPVGYWRYEETGGTSARDLANNSDGAYQNSPTLGVTGALSNDPNKAITLNGSTQWISVPDVAAQHVGNVFSLEAWIKTTTTSQTLLFYGRVVGGYSFGINATSGTLNIAKDAVGTIADSTVAINDGNWHHIVWSRPGTTSGDKIYIDGIDRTGTVTDRPNIANTGSSGIAIGSSQVAGGHYLNGSIDEAAIYGAALTQQQVTQHYNVGIAAACQGAFGQAQADIKAVGRGFGQAQADIKAVGRGFGQAQAAIIRKSVYANLIETIPNIKGYWRLGETPGNVVALDNVNHLAGNLFAGITLGQTGPFTDDPSTSYNMDGVDGTFVQVPSTTALDIPDDQLSVIVWIKTSSTKAKSNPIRRGGGADNYFLRINDGTDVLWNVYTVNPSNSPAVTYPISDGRWHALIGVYDGVNARLYIDGQDVTGGYAKTGNLLNTSDDLGIGSHGGGTSENFEGNIAEVTLANYALSPAQVLEIFSVGWGTRHGQAQALISVSSRAFGQAQADIKSIGYGFGQAQADIKNIATAYSTPYGQAQADIKQTYTDKTGQAQAYIKIVGRGHGQALAIISGDFSTVVDTFNRSTSNGFGTADVGGAWVIGSGTASDFSTDGATGIILSPEDPHGVSLTRVKHTRNYEIEYKVKVTSLPATDTFVRVHGKKGAPDVTNFNGIGVQANFRNNGNVEVNISNDTIGSATKTIIPYSVGSYVWVKAQVIHVGPTGTAYFRAKVWADGSIEPYWQISESATNTRPEGFIDYETDSVGSGPTSVVIDQLNVYEAFAQGIGQAQADIKATNRAYGQAQADIKAVSYAVAQAQADIKAVGRAYGQAQADIKQTYYGHAQAQAEIKQVYYVHGQAQADIKTTYNSHGQAQAEIKQTYYGFGQAQADIKAVGYGFGQAQADIKAVISAHAQAQADIKQTYRAHGQAQAEIKQTYFAHGQSQAEIKQTYQAYGQAQAYLQPRAYGQAQADIKQTYFVHAQAQAEIKQTYFAYAQAQATITRSSWGHGQAQAEIKQVYYAHAQAQADIKQVYFAHGQANADIQQTYYGHGQANAWIKATYFGQGQAQAWIENTYSQHGQANADIKAVGYGHGQAQAWIEQTYNQHGQAQGTILQTYVVHGQAQAWIEQTYNQHGQSQAWIKTTYFAHAQAQAKINAFGVNAYGQAQAYILSGKTAHGQAQADIKAVSYVHGQSQADIKATSNVHGQSQADIKQTYNQHGQAQAQIARVQFAHGQAQAYIKAIVTQSGQSQADIKATSTQSGQSQADIKQTYTQSGQAQAQIAQRSYQHAQAQGTIKAVVTQTGQAQAQIRTTYYVHGQSQAWIKNSYTQTGQAQALILLLRQGYGQAQAQIKQVYLVHAQAQATILQTYRQYGQAQGWIETTINSYGQAQGWIETTVSASGQAQAQITSGTIAFGQAQAFIFRPEAFGQAQAFIVTVHTLKNLVISDDSVLSLTLSDEAISTELDDEDEPDTELSNIEFTILLEDEYSILQLLLDDEAF